MGYKNFNIALIVLAMVFLSGCATMNVANRQEYLRGYRAGVSENMSKFAERFAGNDFPYFYWQAPLVQRLYIPAHVRGGVYIPGHYEYVILDPAEWREIYGYPISTQNKEIEDVPQVDNDLSDLSGSSRDSSGGKSDK